MTTPTPFNFPKRLESVQALRGIAALLVLFFHMAEFQRQMLGSNISDIALVSGFWDRGWAGVDLFFIISGFIMVYVTRQTGRSVGDVRRFMTSRVTRIYPLWWVCAGIMAAYFWVGYGMPAAPDRVSDSNEAFAYAAKSFLLIPQDAPPMLGLGWTLIHEMFFYLVFAAMLFMPRKYLPPALFIWAIITIFAAQIVAPSAHARNVFELMASPLSLEFIAGGLAGYLVTKKQIITPKLLLASGAFLAFLGLVFFPYLEVGSYATPRVVIFLLPFLLLTYGWVGCELQGQMRVPKWLTRLGDWSYSLYLTHYIVLVSLRRIYRKFVPDGIKVGAEGVLDNLIFAILVLGLSILTAAIFYRFIERPSLKFFKKNRSRTH